jgi:hypothetical protein
MAQYIDARPETISFQGEFAGAVPMEFSQHTSTWIDQIELVLLFMG